MGKKGNNAVEKQSESRQPSIEILMEEMRLLVLEKIALQYREKRNGTNMNLRLINFWKLGRGLY